MEKQTISRRKTYFFSDLSNEINDKQSTLTKYIQSPFSLDAFEAQIRLKKANYSAKQRQLTHDIFESQLSPYFNFPKIKQNVSLLSKDNTFTVTAGHQLNLYGGPLYSIYKILDAVRLAEQLEDKYPNYNFVPVFWMATEDHDFEEINHIHLFRDTLTWESSQKGAVGRYKLEGIEDFKSQIAAKFENNPDFVQFLDQFYKKGTLAEATREFLMALAGEYGILILDADDAKLKDSFSLILKKEIETQFSYSKIIEQIQNLEDDDFHAQATPRPINLFHLGRQSRERIIPSEKGYFKIGEKIWTLDELLTDLETHPENFSPNVVFRPLYQEFILPNLCYIGGGGEMSYWLELKQMFNAVGVPYPLTKVRNSIQWFDKSIIAKMNKLGLTINAIFKDKEDLKKEFIFNNSGSELDFSELNEITEKLNEVLMSNILSIDKGLIEYGKSEVTKIKNQIEKVQQKLLRQQKQKSDTEMQQIDGLYERLFPNNGLQERFDNIIPFISNNKDFVSEIYNAIDPFEPNLILLSEV